MNYSRMVEQANARLRKMLDENNACYRLGMPSSLYYKYVAPLKRMISKYSHVISTDNIARILNNDILTSYIDVTRLILPYITDKHLAELPNDIVLKSPAMIRKLPASRLKKLAKKHDLAKVIFAPDKCYAFGSNRQQLEAALFGMHVYRSIVYTDSTVFWSMIPCCYCIGTVDRIRRMLKKVGPGRRESASTLRPSWEDVEIFIAAGGLSILPPKLAINLIDFLCSRGSGYMVYKLALQKLASYTRLHYKVYDYMLNQERKLRDAFMDRDEIARLLSHGQLKAKLSTSTKIKLALKYKISPKNIFDDREMLAYEKAVVVNKLKQF